MQLGFKRLQREDGVDLHDGEFVPRDAVERRFPRGVIREGAGDALCRGDNGLVARLHAVQVVDVLQIQQVDIDEGGVGKLRRALMQRGQLCHQPVLQGQRGRRKAEH